MMGGTIAVITAVLVVNPPFEPEWVCVGTSNRPDNPGNFLAEY